ncbi:hypothetical protein [Streptomyces sp. NPDC048665]|uniref:LGFP repeat-containing protein n=1 Tax=Streptomyces sp. NPDC048665 TaxID=3155490 RepID=UPI0034298692
MLLALVVQAPQAIAGPPQPSAVICGHQVQGAILAKYQEMGGEKSPLGCPKTDELTTPNGVGRYNTFVGGSIYWSPDTGAHPVWGVIGEKWGALGWEAGSLGFPVSDELTNPDGVGKRQQFQSGTIYWHPTLSDGAHAVSGRIGWVWSGFHWESGAFGYPTSDALYDNDNKEYDQRFSNHLTIFESSTGNDIEGCKGPCAGYYGVVPDNQSASDLVNEARVELPLDNTLGLSDWKHAFVVRAWPTLKARLGAAAAAGPDWDQIWQRVPRPWDMNPTNQSSIYKQLVCHTMFSAPKPGGWAGGPSWDFESWRSDIPWLRVMTPSSSPNWGNNECNWN